MVNLNKIKYRITQIQDKQNLRYKHGNHDQRKHGVWAEGMNTGGGSGGGLAGGTQGLAQQLTSSNRRRGNSSSNDMQSVLFDDLQMDGNTSSAESKIQNILQRVSEMDEFGSPVRLRSSNEYSIIRTAIFVQQYDEKQQMEIIDKLFEIYTQPEGAKKYDVNDLNAIWSAIGIYGEPNARLLAHTKSVEPNPNLEQVVVNYINYLKPYIDKYGVELGERSFFNENVSLPEGFDDWAIRRHMDGVAQDVLDEIHQQMNKTQREIDFWEDRYATVKYQKNIDEDYRKQQLDDADANIAQLTSTYELLMREYDDILEQKYKVNEKLIDKVVNPEVQKNLKYYAWDYLLNSYPDVKTDDYQLGQMVEEIISYHARQTKGIKVSHLQNLFQSIGVNGQYPEKGMPSFFPKFLKTPQPHPDLVAALQRMYNLQQELFASQGMDSFEIYRGRRPNSPPRGIPLESWSENKEISRSFTQNALDSEMDYEPAMDVKYLFGNYMSIKSLIPWEAEYIILSWGYWNDKWKKEYQQMSLDLKEYNESTIGSGVFMNNLILKILQLNLRLKQVSSNYRYKHQSRTNPNHDQSEHGNWAEGRGGTRDGVFPTGGGGGGGGIQGAAQISDLASRARNLQKRGKRSVFADKRKRQRNALLTTGSSNDNSLQQRIKDFIKQRASQRMPKNFDVTSYLYDAGDAGGGVSNVKILNINGNTRFYRDTPAYHGRRAQVESDLRNRLDRYPEYWTSIPGTYFPLLADSVSSAMGLDIAPVTQLSSESRVISNPISFIPGSQAAYTFEKMISDYRKNPSSEKFDEIVKMSEPHAILNALIGNTDGHSWNVEMADNPHPSSIAGNKVMMSYDFDYGGAKGAEDDTFRPLFEFKKQYGKPGDKFLSPEMEKVLRMMPETIEFHDEIPEFTRKQIIQRIENLLAQNDSYDMSSPSANAEGFMKPVEDASMQTLKDNPHVVKARDNFIVFSNKANAVGDNLQNMRRIAFGMNRFSVPGKTGQEAFNELLKDQSGYDINDLTYEFNNLKMQMASVNQQILDSDDASVINRLQQNMQSLLKEFDLYQDTLDDVETLALGINSRVASSPANQNPFSNL